MKKYLFVIIPAVAMMVAALADTFNVDNVSVSAVPVSTTQWGVSGSSITNNYNGSSVFFDVSGGLHIQALSATSANFGSGSVTAGSYSGSVLFVTNAAPSNVTIGTTIADRWIVVKDAQGNTFYTPAWATH